MDFLKSLPEQLITLMTGWIVPLFLLYNIVGWVGLPQREADRSTNLAWLKQDEAALRRTLRAAWLVGVLVALLALWVVFGFYRNEITRNSDSKPPVAVAVAGVIGFLLGGARGFVPVLEVFRRAPAQTRRRVLAASVVTGVAVSLAAAVLYYNSGTLVHDVIASAFGWMLVGYAAAYVFEVGK
jgi:uncharacterized membrane protein YfcA